MRSQNTLNTFQLDLRIITKIQYINSTSLKLLLKLLTYNYLLSLKNTWFTQKKEKNSLR